MFKKKIRGKITQVTNSNKVLLQKSKNIVKIVKYVNKISIKKEVRAVKPYPNKVAISMRNNHSGIKRIKSIKKANKFCLRNKKQKSIRKKIFQKRGDENSYADQETTHVQNDKRKHTC